MKGKKNTTAGLLHTGEPKRDTTGPLTDTPGSLPVVLFVFSYVLPLTTAASTAILKATAAKKKKMLQFLQNSVSLHHNPSLTQAWPGVAYIQTTITANGFRVAPFTTKYPL